MASQSTAQFYVSAPNVSGALLTTANPNLDGTGVTAQVFAAGASTAARVDCVHFQAIGATTAGMVRLFLKKNSGQIYLLQEIPVQAVTPSEAVKAWSADYFPALPTFEAPSPLNLQIGDILLASTHNAESFAVTVFGANY